VFDVIAAPYLGRTPRALSGKLQVLQRGTDMVLAEHYTPVHKGRLTAATLETVTFDRPHRIAFRLVRGPVPYATEEFTLTDGDGTSRLDYSGQLGTGLRSRGPMVGRPGRGCMGGGSPVLLHQHQGRSRTARQPRHCQLLMHASAAMRYVGTTTECHPVRFGCEGSGSSL
jgi:hypothetical protein